MIQKIGKVRGMISFGFQVVITRIKRLKRQSLITTLSISLVSSIFIGITFGTDTIQRNLISETLNSGITDINIRIMGEDDFDNINLKEITGKISNIDNVDRVIIKLFPRIDSSEESFSISHNSILENESNAQKTGLFGFSKEDLDFYQQKILSELKTQITTLNFRETIISSYTANKLTIQVGDFFYVNHFLDSKLESSYILKVGSIWDITNTHKVSQDISQIPTDNIHETTILTDFVLMGEDSYFNMMSTFFPDFSNGTIFNHGIISVFIDQAPLLEHNNFTMVMDQFSQLKISILRSIERSLPSNMEIILISSLEKEIEIVVRQLSHTVFSFTLFGLLIISLGLILLFIIVYTKVQDLKRFFGIMRLRGLNVASIYSFFLFEGCLLGILAGLISIIFSMGLIFVVNTFYFSHNPSNVYSTIFSLQFILLLSLSSIFISFLLGLIGHSIIFLQNKDTVIKDLLYNFDFLESINNKQSRSKWRKYFLLSIMIIIVWLLEDFLGQFDVGGVWSVFLSTGRDILSFFVLIVPLLLIIGFLKLFLDKKEKFEHACSILVRPILGDLTTFFFRDFWRRPQQTTRMVLIIILITITAVSPPILISTQESIEEMNIVNEVGSDIRIKGKFHQFEGIDPIKKYPNTIVSSYYTISQFGFFEVGSIDPISTQMILLQTPSSYINTVQFEDFSTSLQNNLVELMRSLEGNNIIAPYSYADNFNWDIGDVRQISLVTEDYGANSVLFRVAGFYHWLPGLNLPPNPTFHACISNFDYLANQTNIFGNADTTLILKLNQSISNQDKGTFLQIIEDSFYSFEVETLDDKLNEYHRSFEGRFHTIFDFLFILTILIGSLGICWFIIGSFQSEQHEFSILRSRGMKKSSIMKLIASRILLLDLIGLLSGLTIGIISNIIYIDFLVSQTNPYLHFLPVIPVIKIVVFLLTIFLSHIAVVVILLLTWSRKSIITDLGIKE